MLFFSIFQVRLSTILTDLPSLIYGQAWQDFPQFFIPFKYLFGCISGGGGTFDFIRKFCIFVCLLKAVNGGFWKHFFRYASWEPLIYSVLIILVAFLAF